MSRPESEPWRALLQALLAGSVPGRAVTVVAHPDDETVSLGGLLDRLPALTLVHVTDGAPKDMSDARRLGFPDRDSYRAARAQELDAALGALGAAPVRRGLDLPDQGAADALPHLVRTFVAELDGAALVITHAYEGGHPDHDSCAFAVQAACVALTRAGRRAPVRLEFPSYHQREGVRVVSRFHPDPTRPEQAYPLSPDRLAAKRAALACHRTQAEVLDWFTEPEVERLRAAPDYDFTAPPPSGEALYDGWGWTLTSAAWRARAADALYELGLEGPAA